LKLIETHFNFSNNVNLSYISYKNKKIYSILISYILYLIEISKNFSMLKSKISKKLSLNKYW